MTSGARFKASSSSLKGLHSRLAATDHDIAAWARKHLEPVNFDNRTVLPVELAKLVVEREAEYGWMPDPLTGFDTPQVTEEDIQSIRVARRELGPDIAYRDCNLPNSSLWLLEPSKLGAVQEALLRSRELDEKLTNANAVRPIGGDSSVLQKAEQLSAELLER